MLRQPQMVTRLGRLAKSPRSINTRLVPRSYAHLRAGPVSATRSYSSSSSSSSGTNSKSGPGTTAALALALLAASAYTYYSSTDTDNPLSSILGIGISGGGDKTFTYTVGRGSRRQSQTFDLLSPYEAEAKLRANEDSNKLDRRGNPIVKWDRNWLGSNEPCEDRSAVDVVPRGRSSRDISSTAKVHLDSSTPQEGGKDLALFSIMDGHGGWATSEMLSTVLHPALVTGLASLQAGYAPGQPQGGWKGMMRKLSPAYWVGAPWTPGNVSQAISER